LEGGGSRASPFNTYVPCISRLRISPHTTPELSNAAKIALTLREKTNGTWGFAWKAACWARLGEGDSAWKTWSYQLQYVEPNIARAEHLGLFPNLFNSEGSAIIMNGNGCATAVVTEMLVQSHDNAIDFLPALTLCISYRRSKAELLPGVDLSWDCVGKIKCLRSSQYIQEPEIFAALGLQQLSGFSMGLQR
jgi:hypothetical protein